MSCVGGYLRIYQSTHLMNKFKELLRLHEIISRLQYEIFQGYKCPAWRSLEESSSRGARSVLTKSQGMFRGKKFNRNKSIMDLFRLWQMNKRSFIPTVGNVRDLFPLPTTTPALALSSRQEDLWPLTHSPTPPTDSPTHSPSSRPTQSSAWPTASVWSPPPTLQFPPWSTAPTDNTRTRHTSGRFYSDSSFVVEISRGCWQYRKYS